MVTMDLSLQWGLDGVFITFPDVADDSVYGYTCTLAVEDRQAHLISVFKKLLLLEALGSGTGVETCLVGS